MRNRLSWIGFGIVAVGVTVLVFAPYFTDLGSGRSGQIASLIAGIALVVVIGGGLFQRRAPLKLSYVAIWAAILVGLALLYNFRAALGIDLD